MKVHQILLVLEVSTKQYLVFILQIMLKYRKAVIGKVVNYLRVHQILLEQEVEFVCVVNYLKKKTYKHTVFSFWIMQHNSNQPAKVLNNISQSKILQKFGFSIVSRVVNYIEVHQILLVLEIEQLTTLKCTKFYYQKQSS